MMLSRAALMSVSGYPVTGSLVFRGSIGPAVTLRLPLPFAGMSLAGCCVCVWVRDCVAVFDLCARLQAVVQKVCELYFPGLADCMG